MRASFITWYPYCRRSDTIAAALGAPSHLIHYLTFKRPSHAPLKYVLQTVTTLKVLRRERPELVLVAAPPIFAVLPVFLYARFTGARVVIDAHTGLFEHTRWKWLLPLTRALMVRADAVVVTGAHLRDLVRSWGANVVIIGDVPVSFVAGRPPATTTRPRVVVVNTFSVDEPVDAVLAAARLVPEADFFVTGEPDVHRLRVRGRLRRTHAGRRRGRRPDHARSHDAARRLRGDGAREAARHLRLGAAP
jgi:hypothetical protein